LAAQLCCLARCISQRLLLLGHLLLQPGLALLAGGQLLLGVLQLGAQVRRLDVHTTNSEQARHG
jgi:hypothetical protein